MMAFCQGNSLVRVEEVSPGNNSDFGVFAVTHGIGTDAVGLLTSVQRLLRPGVGRSGELGSDCLEDIHPLLNTSAHLLFLYRMHASPPLSSKLW